MTSDQARRLDIDNGCMAAWWAARAEIYYLLLPYLPTAMQVSIEDCGRICLSAALSHARMALADRERTGATA